MLLYCSNAGIKASVHSCLTVKPNSIVNCVFPGMFASCVGLRDDVFDTLAFNKHLGVVLVSESAIIVRVATPWETHLF